jgi:hypothetical protein
VLSCLKKINYKSMEREPFKEPEPADQLPVYRSMEADPYYEGKNIVRWPEGAYGYDRAVVDEEGRIVTIGSSDREGRPEYDLEETVTLVGGAERLYGLEPDQDGTIVEFRQPFDENGSTDHIIRIEQQGRRTWLSPARIAKKYTL